MFPSYNTMFLTIQTKPAAAGQLLVGQSIFNRFLDFLQCTIVQYCATTPGRNVRTRNALF